MKVLLVVLLCSSAMADLAKVRSEPNLEKRSQAALEYADESFTESRKAYAAGDLDRTAAALDEVDKAVELAETSLLETKKDASRSPKYFKHAEIKTGNLLRRIDGFSQDMNVADRSMVEKLKDKVQQAHDRLLLSIMTKKKK